MTYDFNRYALGIDVGGTTIKFGLVSQQGKLIAKAHIDSEARLPPERMLERLGSAVASLCEANERSMTELDSIGLAVPGPLNLKRRMFLDPPNLPAWHNYAIGDAIEKLFGRATIFANDANAAAYGEFWVGAGTRTRSLALLTLGTGVGGGIITEGKLINGENSFGSECGHIIVDSSPSARLCVWGGGRGELEAYASASAVASIAKELVESGEPSSLASVVKANGRLTALDVYNAACQGDDVALTVIDQTAKILGVGIATIVAIADPGLVLIGGAMTFGGPSDTVGQRFLQGMTASFQSRTFPHVAANTVIQFAELGSDAGILGAAGLAFAHRSDSSQSPDETAISGRHSRI